MSQATSRLKSPEALEAIFRPGSIAVVGASSSPEKWGFKILKNIVEAGFRGPIYPINPKGGEILGRRCSPTLKAVEGAIDLAVIVIPARLAPEAIKDCGEKGVKAAVVITGGFSEAGREGERLQHRLVEEAKRYGVRVVGPNCQGVNNPHHGLCASWPLLTEKGHLAILSQSGTVGAALMDWPERGIRALAQLARCQMPDPRPRTPTPKSQTLEPGEKGISIIQQVLKEGRHLLEPEALKLLDAYNLSVVPHRLALSEDEALLATEALGLPVALKIVSRDLFHKSEAGGVLLDLRGKEKVREAYRRILERVQGLPREGGL